MTKIKMSKLSNENISKPTRVKRELAYQLRNQIIKLYLEKKREKTNIPN